jgi:hypothetical protein
MNTVFRRIGGLVAGLTFLALIAAPSAAAAPVCTDVGQTVTFCETNGSTQLTTTPPPWNYGGWQGIGYWPLVGGYGLGPW